MILIVAGGIVSLSLSLPEKKARTSVPAAVPAFAPTASTSTVNPGIPNPQPWQYDPVTDQHWVPTPGHVHWHSGRPPANPGGNTTIIDSGTIPGAPPISSTPQAVNPNIPNPQPWQYDPVTNQHWDPRTGHVHWHSGQAPPPGQRQ